jgi:hypothetical protein
MSKFPLLIENFRVYKIICVKVNLAGNPTVKKMSPVYPAPFANNPSITATKDS